MWGTDWILVVIIRKGNAVNDERTLQSCLSSGNESTVISFCKGQLITSEFIGYPAYLDTKNNLSTIERTKGKQRRSISKKEINIENVGSTYRSLSSTNRNIFRKNKNIDLGHSACTSTRYCSWNQMPKCQWFRLAKANSSLLEKLNRYLHHLNHRLGSVLLLWVFRSQGKIMYYSLDWSMLYYSSPSYEYVLRWCSSWSSWYW